MSLLTRKEIAERIGVKVATLRRNYETRPDFPKPAKKFSNKNVWWELADVVKFERGYR